MTTTNTAAEITRYQAWADAWEKQYTTHRADIFTRDHGTNCLACHELEASMRYNRYAVRMLNEGQRPLTGAAWSSKQRAISARIVF